MIQDTVSLVQSPVESAEKTLMTVIGFASSLRSTGPLLLPEIKDSFFMAVPPLLGFTAEFS